MSTYAFRYSAVNEFGQRTRGTIRAEAHHDAFRKLVAAGLTPVSIDEIKARTSAFSRGRVRASDVAELTRELAVLVAAKIPLDRGLASIAEHEGKPAVSEMVRDIATQIEAGSPMTQALSRHAHVFGDVYIETVKSAERSGNLASVMEHLADMLEMQIETKQLLTRALTYPIIVLMVVMLAVTVIVVFVVPKFGATFASQGIKLPLVTRMLQATGQSVGEYWPMYAAALVAVILVPVLAWKTTGGRSQIEGLMLRTPYVSRVIISVCTARFTRVLGIGLSSGLGVIESLEIAGRSTGQSRFRAETEVVANQLRQGHSLVDSVSAMTMIPSFAKRMLGAGKDSKEVSSACNVLSRHYERESNHLTKNVSSVIEPILTVAMAVIVLLVALSVFLPMWQMVGQKH